MVWDSRKPMENAVFPSKFQFFELEKSEACIKPTGNQVYGISEVLRTPWAAITSKNPKKPKGISKSAVTVIQLSSTTPHPTVGLVLVASSKETLSEVFRNLEHPRKNEK